MSAILTVKDLSISFGSNHVLKSINFELGENDDSGNGVYDIAGSLEESMENAWLTVRTARLRKVICYAANTLNVASVLIMLFMQIRIWIQG